MRILQLTLLSVVLASLSACPGGESGGEDKSLPPEQINEDNALEQADQIIEDIENL